jgi:hypothetical protein
MAFYSWVLNAAYALGWTADWANTLHRTLEVCLGGLTHILIYDGNLPRIDCLHAVASFSAVAPHARTIVVAHRLDVDEGLWRSVLRRGGYDLISRTAGIEQMKRELRFAWLSIQPPDAVPFA